MGNVPASGAIQEKTSNHFISDFFLILIGSNKSKWTIAQKRSLKQNHWTWDSNIWSWKGNGKTCENLNECETKTHDCKEPAICHDLDGTYDCKCPRGYRRHTTVSWLPQNGLRMVWIRLYFKVDNVCIDIDECFEEMKNCYDPSAWKLSRMEFRTELNLFSSKCINLIGSSTCECRETFIADSKSERYACIPRAPYAVHQMTHYDSKIMQFSNATLSTNDTFVTNEIS